LFLTSPYFQGFAALKQWLLRHFRTAMLLKLMHSVEQHPLHGRVDPSLSKYWRAEPSAASHFKFWAAIDRARKSGDGWHGMYVPLQTELSKLDVADIITRYLIFEKYCELAYKQKLWAAAATIMNSSSDDSFDYYRSWLVA